MTWQYISELINHFIHSLIQELFYTLSFSINFYLAYTAQVILKTLGRLK